MRPVCLTIAGFDPSGGAGIVADCKTFEQIRVTGLSVLTANTFQTADRFAGLTWIPAEHIVRQLVLLLESYKIAAVKIGLIENGAVLLEVLRTIRGYQPDVKIIWDPVIRATADNGNELALHRFQDDLPEILARIDLITPNMPEKEILFGDTNLGQLTQTFRTAILVKGGHSTIKGKDLLFLDGEMFAFNPKISTNVEKHGSGCVLSAAIAVHLAKKFPFKKSIFLAKRYVERFLTSQQGLTGNHSR